MHQPYSPLDFGKQLEFYNCFGRTCLTDSLLGDKRIPAYEHLISLYFTFFHFRKH